MIATYKPLGKSRTTLNLLVLLFVLGYPIYTGASDALWRYDLYQNGAIVEGEVKTVRPLTDIKDTGDNRYFQMYETQGLFDHAIAYPDGELHVQLDNELQRGAKVKVYYSRLHPENAVLSEDGQPWTLTDALLTARTVAGVAVLLVAFMVVATIFIGRARRKS